jgi:mono/diheme cytochrome c family protein
MYIHAHIPKRAGRRGGFSSGLFASGLAGALVFAASFGCTPALPEPTSADVVVAQREEPSASLEDLRRGRTLYLQRCGGCHTLRAPSEFKADEWQGQVRRMETAHGVRLSEPEESDILRYLRVASTAAPR